MKRLLALLCYPGLIWASWTGHFEAEFRQYQHNGLDGQPQWNISYALAPEYDWHEGQQYITFKPFFRADAQDDARTHADIRELSYIYVQDPWELRVGLRKVFWGVLEANHLVDIINQTDSVESIDGEQKLGQPMLNVSLVQPWGIFDVYMMPYFRERTFPGKAGRLRSSPYVETDLTTYDSRAKQGHIDWALRWAQTMGIWDIGVAGFQGTNRTPVLSLKTHGDSTVLAPHYDIITRVSVDAQATLENTLWKFEALHQRGQGTFNSVGLGMEYTFWGVGGSAKDLGVLAEYHFDDRKAASPNPMNNDFMLGLRLTFNDVDATELLSFVVFDGYTHSRLWRLEASQRLNDSLKATLEGTMISHTGTSQSFHAMRRDDNIALTLAYYF